MNAVITETILAVFAVATIVGYCLPNTPKDIDND